MFALLSKDDLHFYIEVAVAEQSGYLKKKLMEDSARQPIVLSNIKGEILEIVVDYLNHKVSNHNKLVLLGKLS